MKLVFILAAFLFGAAQSTSDRPYELKGEAPGMTLKQFRSNHRRAECVRKSATLTSCHVYDGVSFAGVPAQTFKGCPTPECVFQGIFADFIGERMVLLRYGVSLGSANKVIAVLKGKYGEPKESTETPKRPGGLSSATWRNAIGYLAVSDVWDGDHPLNSRTDITSALNDAGESKDI